MQKRIWRRALCLAAFSLASVASVSRAQGYISPFIGNNFGGDSGCQTALSCQSPASNVGLAIGRGSGVAFEEEFLYAKDFFGQSASQSTNLLTLMSNVVVGPRIGYVRPYGLVGFGFMKAHAKLSASQLTASDTNAGWNLGGGLEIAGRHFGVRGDIRQVHGLQDFGIPGLPISGLKLDFNRTSAGVVLRF
jgi:opacity protein-like surface antigen